MVRCFFSFSSVALYAIRIGKQSIQCNVDIRRRCVRAAVVAVVLVGFRRVARRRRAAGRLQQRARVSLLQTLEQIATAQFDFIKLLSHRLANFIKKFPKFSLMNND